MRPKGCGNQLHYTQGDRDLDSLAQRWGYLGGGLVRGGRTEP